MLLLALAACPRPPVAPPIIRQEPPAAARPDGAHPPAHEEPDVVGVVHVVRRGETLYRISRAYGVSVDDLLEVNGLADARSIPVGFEIFVPGATRELPIGSAPAPEPEPDAVATLPRPAGERPGKLAWPLRGPGDGGRAGVIYSKFGPREGQPHDGVDISAPEGTTIVAASAGVVIFAGERSGYGSIVILRHAGQLLTLYAHASELLVKEGDRVAEGAPVARVGRSGRTTGPHLHFEVREGIKPRDPLPFLR
ncbi:MAG TPA: LysM peptidoglycan-binding domain-containing M23 family metallopeptidase [Anaeromyxobacteraceae bacterium]|nr:LysM peptidoglycan-binding domain-containing M23 family metallopeptidase [Anaeromyxobacteraceae bacterium]